MKIGFVVIFLLLTIVSLVADDGVFTAAGIQFEIDPVNYESKDKFFDVVENEILSVLDAEYRPDLIIFPEYIGVFYQLIDFNDLISENETFESALVEVLRRNPRFDNMADLFIIPEAWNSYISRWSNLAAEYNVSIIAGSCFISDDGRNLYNRTFSFGPEGRLLYTQDKVFLTEFETDIVGLSPGRLEDADFFQVEDQNIALTICRDAYFPQWEQKYSGAFLWVDIKANGEVFDADQQQSFMRALPLRLIRSDVNFGMTVCAVGSYLDLLWEGESSAVYKYGNRLVLADIAESADSADSISISISME